MSAEVRRIFSKISQHYDAANDILSFGLHRIWRWQLLKIAQLSIGQRVLDLCCGTGEIALCAAKAAGPSGKVVGLDFVPEMLAIAAKKARQAKIEASNAPICWVQGDGMSIPLHDAALDRVLIGYGIRNVDDPLICLREIWRVLSPGGLLAVLEFGQTSPGPLSSLSAMYCSKFVPCLGGLLTHDRLAYDYLQQSSSNFPSGEGFLKFLREAGFSSCYGKPVFPGLAFVYSARKT